MAHRALTVLLGPHGTWIPYTRTSGPLQTVVDHYPTPDRDGRLSDGSPTDPYPLARLTRTLAAFADLMHQPDDVRADGLRSTGELANVTARVLTITAVAARYTMVHMPLREAMPPLTVGTFAEDMLAAVRDLGRVGESWIGGMTTLTPPSHRFVAASRDLYEQLARLDQQLTQEPDTVETEAVAATLARAAHRFSRHLDTAEQLPEQLLHSGLMFAPARQLAPHPDRITEHVRGRLVTVRTLDAKDLVAAWHAGVTAAHGATKPSAKQPARL